MSYESVGDSFGTLALIQRAAAQVIGALPNNNLDSRQLQVLKNVMDAAISGHKVLDSSRNEAQEAVNQAASVLPFFSGVQVSPFNFLDISMPAIINLRRLIDSQNPGDISGIKSSLITIFNIEAAAADMFSNTTWGAEVLRILKKFLHDVGSGLEAGFDFLTFWLPIGILGLVAYKLYEDKKKR